MVSVNKVISTASNITQTSKKVPFCHQVWAQVQESRQLRPYPYQTVEHHSDFNAFNFILVRGRVGYGTEQMVCGKNKTIKEAIIDSDLQFKRLKPTNQPMTVFRCIGEKPEFFTFESKLYKKALSTKPGEVIMMDEYAYAAGGIGYAKVYRGVDDRAIYYEIEVPKNAKVSYTGRIDNGRLRDGDECVFPRSSKFLCIDNKKMEDGSHYIKLRYILPNEPWRE